MIHWKTVVGVLVLVAVILTSCGPEPPERPRLEFLDCVELGNGYFLRCVDREAGVVLWYGDAYGHPVLWGMPLDETKLEGWKE